MLIFEGSITERTSSGECLQVIYKDDRVSGPSGLLHFTTSPSEDWGGYGSFSVEFDSAGPEVTAIRVELEEVRVQDTGRRYDYGGRLNVLRGDGYRQGLAEFMRDGPALKTRLAYSKWVDLSGAPAILLEESATALSVAADGLAVTSYTFPPKNITPPTGKLIVEVDPWVRRNTSGIFPGFVGYVRIHAEFEGTPQPFWTNLTGARETL